MKNTTAKNDPRVLAIRADPKVGDGSCTSIDECYDAEDLVRELDLAEATTPEAAVKWALESEGIFLEQATNCREGHDDDRSLRALEEWENS